MARSLALAAAALVAPAGAQLNILAVADWGGAECLKGGCKNPSGSVPFTTDVQLNVSTAMGVIGAQLNPSFVLALGDNFYEDGISCLNDPTPGCTTDATSHRFKDTFEKVYTAPSLQVPWWLNAGNHDWHAVANATAQLAYTHAPGTSKRWNFPAFYYSMNTTFTDASSGASLTAQFVFIDTVILCGLSVPGAKGQPVPPADADPASVQLQWLTATLAASTADWLIVAGHYPVFSVAEHGSTACLIQQVQPLLVANKVALYINGHDHNLQHLDDGTGVVYVDVGPGHDFDNDTSHSGTVPPGASKFFLAPANGGFGSLTFFNKSTATISLYEATAPPTMVHGITLTNPRA